MKKLIGALNLGSYESTDKFVSQTCTLFLKAPSASSPDIASGVTSRLSINRSRMGNILLGNATGNAIPINRSLNLFIRGSIGDEIFKTLPLYIKGLGFESNSIPLYIQGGSLESNSIPLYISGGITTNNNLNLFLKGVETSSINNQLPLSLPNVSLFNNQFAKWMPLFLQGPDFNNLNLISLFIKSDRDTLFEQIPLYIKGDRYSIGSSIPLYLHNLSVESSIPLFLQGPFAQIGPLGFSNEGWIPLNNNIDLYIKVKEGGTIPLFLKANNLSDSQSIDLFIHGLETFNKSLNLSIPETSSVLDSVLKLFTHGF